MKIILKTPLVNVLFRKTFQVKDTRLNREIFGLKFPNPVGLAAGFDKDGRYFRQMEALGFGFIEIGTVTPRPQEGNPRPRLFRLPEDRALVNRMGFNNHGVEAMVSRLRKSKKSQVIIGGNIGKNKLTPNENAENDYITCFEQLYPYVDYFVVNVSSPNTPGLRELQEKEPLKRLLTALQGVNAGMPVRKPLLLKIAPDLTEEQLDDIVEIAFTCRLNGLIATNTTIERTGLTTSQEKLEAIGAGGLSGAPVKDRSTEVIRYLSAKSEGKIPIIGVGGIDSPDAALEKLKAGASLVQVYTGLIYEGPALVRKICKGILAES